MYYNGTRVNINNYKSVFKGCSRGVLDVVRSAILDDTPLGKFIDLCCDDYHLLFEVKMALDVGLDISFLDTFMGSGCSFEVLATLRGLYSKGININPLLKYFENRVSYPHIKYIVKWYGKGYSLERYDFSILPSELLEVFDYGFSLNYPMYLFNNGKQYSESYIRCCLKLLSNSKPIDMFLGNDWHIENLDMLASYSKSKYYDKLIEYVTVNITTSVLEELMLCCRSGMPLDGVSALDEDGLYVFDPNMIRLIRGAFNNKYDYTRLINTELSFSDMRSIYKEMELSSRKRISGRL